MSSDDVKLQGKSNITQSDDNSLLTTSCSMSMIINSIKLLFDPLNQFKLIFSNTIYFIPIVARFSSIFSREFGLCMLEQPGSTISQPLNDGSLLLL